MRTALVHAAFAVAALALAHPSIASEPSSLTIALPPASSAGPIRIAMAAGYFAEQGLDVHLRAFGSRRDVQAAVAKGDAMIGVTDLDADFFAFAATHELRAISSLDGDQAGYPGNVLLIRKAADDAGFHRWRDMKDRAIGLPSSDPGLRYAILQIAKKYGIDAAGVRLIAFRTYRDEAIALQHGKIDAAIMSASAAAQAAASQKGLRFRRVGDELVRQQTVVFAGKAAIADRAFLARFESALRKGSEDYAETFLQRDDGGEVLRGEHFDRYRSLLSPHIDAPPALFAYVIPWADHLGRLDTREVREQLQFWQAQGRVDRAIEVEQLVDTR